MTTYSPRIYIYKITFEEVSYYYYGAHKEKVFDEEYWGTPVTNKWCWDFYTPKKQILQEFSYTDEGWLEALEVEKRLIKPFYQIDKWCLNESCGGKISLKIRRETGKKSALKIMELKLGIFSLTKKERSEAGKKGSEKGSKKGGETTFKNKKGVFSLSPEERKEASGKGGKKSKENNLGIHRRSKEEMTEHGRKGGFIGGKIAYELGLGVHGRTKEKRTEDSKKGANQKWMCLETGHTTNAGALTNYQKKRDIDTSKRKRVS